MVAIAPNGDVYIGEGHANESPNDSDSEDPANNVGAARIIRVDKNGRFISQWYGNEVGQGKFSSAHGLAIDDDRVAVDNPGRAGNIGLRRNGAR